MDPETLALLTNKELISINQDEEPSAVIVGTDYTTRAAPASRSRLPPRSGTTPLDPNRPVMFKHLSNNEYVLAFFNFDDNDGLVYTGSTFGLTVASGMVSICATLTGEEKKAYTRTTALHVPAHDCKIYRCKLVER